MAGKIQPAQTSLWFADTTDNFEGKYIDIAQCASFVNRRMYEQGKIYFVESIKLYVVPQNADNTFVAGFATIHDTWVTRNAWTKAKMLWNQMNDKVLEDNPSVQGKWRNFKAYMDAAHFSGGGGPAGPTLNLLPKDAGGNVISTGEWEMSELVLPQHNVTPATGVVLPADQFHVHMLGADVGTIVTALNSGAIIQMYEDTRARVVTSPEVPAEMSTSWGTVLTDDGSQEPELADLIEAESDEPPYDKTDYVGATANWSEPSIVGMSMLNPYSPDDVISGFAVPLGLIKVGFTSTGTSAGSSQCAIELKLAKGHYKGLAATEMRQ